MNGPFVQARANGLSRRLARECGSDEERIRRAFSLCFGRFPDQHESQVAADFLSNANQVKPETGLAAFCQGLLAAAEFRNLD
jgi:hypothetical protein